MEQLFYNQSIYSLRRSDNQRTETTAAGTAGRAREFYWLLEFDWTRAVTFQSESPGLHGKIKKVFSSAHVRSLEQRVRNAHDQSEQTLTCQCSAVQHMVLFHCDVIIKNLDNTQNCGWNLKQLGKIRVFFKLTLCVYLLSFGKYRLSKLLFFHCFYMIVGMYCQPVYKINRQTQTLWTHCSKTSEDRYVM